MKRKCLKPLCGKCKKRHKLLKGGGVPESCTQAQILNWLQETHLLHWRQNSGNVFAGPRRVKLGDAGLPDIVLVVPPNGLILGLECKSDKGTLRPKQREFAAKLRAAGGVYKVVRSLTQAMDAVAQTIGEELWKQLSPTVVVGV